MERHLVRLSKFVSKVLRHDPESIGLRLDEAGWADVDELLSAANHAGVNIDRSMLDRVVAENDKKRFAMSEDGTKIRASQGHSVSVELGLAPVEPPEVLYHGTADRFAASIREQGLLPRARQHVHLSLDEATAVKVGQRHGKPVVVLVESGRMHKEGFAFYLSDNGVWLTERVPPKYLKKPWDSEVVGGYPVIEAGG
jgi:putative RNA 2'-phosphotransferase